MVRTTKRAETTGRGWTPGPWQLLLAGLLLGALWALTLISLTPLFEFSAWLWRALAIITATIAVACVLRALRSTLRTAAVLGGVLAGALCWIWWLARSGRAELWWLDPGTAINQTVSLALSAVAPMMPQGPFEDVLLFAVLLLAILTAVLFVGLSRPLASGILPALLLLVPPAVTGLSVAWWSLLGVGVLLALLAWAGSPRLSFFGLIAAGAAVTIAAGAVAIAPPTRDRIWNEQILLGPLGTTMPDVTITLANDLRERSQTRAFRFTSSGGVPYRFALATLADFEGGHWLPQNELTAEGLTVADRRSETSVPPISAENEDLMARGVVSPSPSSVTITIEGLRSSWLPLPQGASSVSSAGERTGFDPHEWRWIDEANTARSEHAITRIGDSYTSDAGVLSSELFESLEELMRERERDGIVFWPNGLSDESSFALFPAVTDGPNELAPYLTLPDGLPAALIDAAQQAAGGAGDRLSVGIELQRWFRGGGFVYDESAPYLPGSDPNDPYAVMTALLAERSGFCVHYASTFAVMARHLGAPTRIVIGYAGRAPSHGEGVVRGGDLHAWPEIFIDGMGWIAFEPTPGGAGLRADTLMDVPATPELPAGAESPEETTPEPETPIAEEEPPAEMPDPLLSEEAPGSGGKAPNEMLRGIAIALGALIAVAALAGPALTRLERSSRRRTGIAGGDHPAQDSWLEFLDTAVDLGYLQDTADGQAPRAQTAEAIVDHLETRGILAGQPAEAARRLADGMTAERYDAAGSSVDRAPQRDDTGSALHTALAGLRDGATRPARMRARLLPRSLFRR